MACVYSNGRFGMDHDHKCIDCKHDDEPMQLWAPVCLVCYGSVGEVTRDTFTGAHQCNWEAKDEAES